MDGPTLAIALVLLLGVLVLVLLGVWHWWTGRPKRGRR
jgi:hypothetical protein